MRKLLASLIIAMLSVGVFAQSGTDVFDFIRNAPWELNDAEIQAKYQENILQLPDSIVQLAKGVLPISSNIIGGLKFNDYDAFAGYIIDEETKTPNTIICLLNPLQTTSPTLMSAIDSVIVEKFGKHIEKPEEWNSSNQLENGITFYISNMWELSNADIVSTCLSFEYIDEDDTKQTIYLYGIIAQYVQDEDNINKLERYRVKFRGVPINGDPYNFCYELGQLGYVRDYGYTPNGNSVASLTGYYGGEKCRLFIYATPITKTVYQVRVIIKESSSWSLIRNSYYSFKNRFENKYGEPWMSEEKFEYPYEDGDGLELRSIERGKASYYSSFSNTEEIGIGYIDMIINASYNQGWISIDFKDGQNLILNESEMSDSL